MYVRIFYIAISLIISQLCFGQKFSFLAEAGTSYRLVQISDSLTDDYASYLSGKKHGNNFSIEPVWFSEGNGIGIKYSLFQNEISADSIRVSLFEKKSISEKINLHYIGLQYHNRLQFGQSRFFGELNAGLGAIFYRNTKKEYKTTQTLIAGRTYALNASLSLEYAILKSLSAYFNAAAFIANIDKVDEDGISVIYNPRESLTRFDLNFGLRYNLY